MTDAALLREKNYPHNVVYEFDRSKQIRTFILDSTQRALIFVCEDNLGSDEALLDVSVLEKLLESSPVRYNAGGVVDALSLLAKGNVERVILDESVFDRDLIYIPTVGRNAAIEIRPDDLRKILADLGFDSESEKPKLINYDFGYTAIDDSSKHRVISGIQPSGDMTLGNYLGAIINWKKQIEKYDENFFFLADLHSLTVLPDPADLRNRIRQTAMTLIACGLDLEKAALFRQSDLGGYHAELAWIFSCLTPEGRLEQMTQFKDKSQKQQMIGTGLKIYPILMAADISLYQATLVPVGEDQRQHLELCREIVRRFNNRYGYTMPVPKAEVPEVLARVMSLADGTKKMSKSDENRDSCIYLLDSPDEINRKIKRAKTDPDPTLSFDENRPEVFNLLSIYQVLSGKEKAEVEANFEGKGAAVLKKELTELLVEDLKPIREKYNDLTTNPSLVDAVLQKGKERVEPIAKQTLAIAKQRVGL
ncbi:MAG TPA: tryptophan--tRNA ligase [Planktothrix sp. UBA10369]|jgi:tryptophanyl-tRNA synthetase|nr:tryptophan--tRNA ligase [Planktothrix sp. UBA10369]